MDFTFDLTTPEGKPAIAIAKVLEARRKELGETALQSCVAITINILRSLRAQTAVAKEGKMNVSVTLADDKYFPSFKREKGTKGKNISKRVLRRAEGCAVISPERVYWRIGKYSKGEVAHSYEIVDQISPEKQYKYIVVAASAKDAKQYAKERHKRRVLRFKGLARHAISLAMTKIYTKEKLDVNSITRQAFDIAQGNVETSVQDTGFNSGTVNVHVHDNLQYAILALKGGESAVNVAIANALNKTVGMIQHRIHQLGGRFDQSLKMTVEELAGRQIL